MNRSTVVKLVVIHSVTKPRPYQGQGWKKSPKQTPSCYIWKWWFLVSHLGPQLTLLRKWWILVSHKACWGVEGGWGGTSLENDNFSWQTDRFVLNWSFFLDRQTDWQIYFFFFRLIIFRCRHLDAAHIGIISRSSPSASSPSPSAPSSSPSAPSSSPSCLSVVTSSVAKLKGLDVGRVKARISHLEDIVFVFCLKQSRVLQFSLTSSSMSSRIPKMQNNQLLAIFSIIIIPASHCLLPLPIDFVRLTNSPIPPPPFSLIGP